MRPVSANRTADGPILLLRALFAWLIADGDLHLKNLAVLRIAPPGSSHFSLVRLAPAYDIVTTRIFPGLEHDAMALTLNGKRNRLNRQDFGRAAATRGLPRTAASHGVDEVCAALRRHLAAFMTDNPSLIRAQAEWQNRLDDFCR